MLQDHREQMMENKEVKQGDNTTDALKALE